MIRDLWFRWKALRLPWRKRFLVGHDLAGNTFWEFRSQLQQGHFRRILKPSNPALPHSDVQIPPQWIQWLRYTRRDPPSLEEQQQDILRQERMKVLAAEADARWNAKPSFLAAPEQRGASSKPLLEGNKKMEVRDATEWGETDGVAVRQQDVFAGDHIGTTESDRPAKLKESPWKEASKTKDEPQPWSPQTAKRR